jgi:hypothetical protein
VDAGYEYQGSADQTRMRPSRLPKDEIKRRMVHLRSVEPPPRNVQQCYAHVDDNKRGEGAPSTRTDTRSRMAKKQPIASDHSKKRPRSSEATGAPENPTSKHHRIIQDWLDEDKEENATADLLNPR